MTEFYIYYKISYEDVENYYQTAVQVKENGNDVVLISIPYFYVNVVGMMVF